ncbi:hypothetical protein FBEOM_10295 [Fusarium beomiforme]|uniref:BTB domain-containing protein n=1 Tax=Fusarium beomiforme TaxID=44412 RepID=A0A9P5ABP9_9HYPO|nr:hypothetical protein FBEOM_10295 [Fusarium beomiforme]
MKKSLLELDPQADALLILKCPNLRQVHAQTAGETPKARNNKSTPIKENDTSKPPKTREDIALIEPYLENGEPNELEFRVSAKHLCLASPVFRSMINGSFKESQPNDEGLLEVRTSEWNAQALLIVLDIIHGHHRSVPRRLSRDIIAQIGLIVDYYDCLEVVQIFGDSWFMNVQNWLLYFFNMWRDNTDSVFKDDETLLLFIAWSYRSTSAFESLTSSAIFNTECLIETHLPIPTQILACKKILSSDELAVASTVLADFSGV